MRASWTGRVLATDSFMVSWGSGRPAGDSSAAPATAPPRTKGNGRVAPAVPFTAFRRSRSEVVAQAHLDRPLRNAVGVAVRVGRHGDGARLAELGAGAVAVHVLAG